MSVGKSVGAGLGLLLAVATGCFNQPKIDVGSLKCKTDENCPTGYRCVGATATILGACTKSAGDGAIADVPTGQGGEAGQVAEVSHADSGAVAIDGTSYDVEIADGSNDQSSQDPDAGAADLATTPHDLRWTDSPSMDPETGSDVPITGNGGAGGATSTGGATGLGGAGGTATGGIVASGGLSGTGGAVATGGMAGTSGAVATGGTTVPPVDCGPLASPTNGSVAHASTTVGATATYSCAAGFGPSGSSTRYCLADGNWSGVAPTCVPANCPGLPSPTHGLVSAPTLTFNSTATYSCSTGYDLAGSPSRSCQADGTWSGVAPTCAPVDCGALTAPANGSVNATATTFSSTATYSCDTGYKLSSNTARTCQANKQWSGAAPTCSLVDCGVLANPTNGSVSATATTYNSTASYSCANGYELSGGASRVCQADGNWSGSAPTCVMAASYGAVCSTAAECPPESTCCNGSVQTCDATRLPSGDGTNPGQFVVSSDGLTVTDTITGLVWQRDGSGARTGCAGSGVLTCTWAEAKAYCAGVTLGGLAGWRLPARGELLTIVDYTRSSPAIDPTVFPSTPSEGFWTLSVYSASSSQAWLVAFDNGPLTPAGAGSAYRVRCVR